MSTSGKVVKNPCMVCRRTVTTKTGLQCQGSCKAWIHFGCCSYTPGKIKDIKAKLIKVRCPCPHCTPDVPKEELVKGEGSFSCVNKKCPMNLSKCAEHECPENKIIQMPSAAEWPGVACGAACKRNKSNTNTYGNMGDRPSELSCPPRQPSANQAPCPMNPCRRQPPSCLLPCTGPQCAPTPCSQPPNTPPLFSPPFSPSPPCPEPYRNHSSTPPTCAPPQMNPGQVMPSISVVENMCETVGLLSDQLNQLMSKMTQVLNPGQKIKRSSGSKSPGGGSGNSCLCSQNPRRS